MKTKEELNALKDEVENVSKKLHELTEEELDQVVGGTVKLDAKQGLSLNFPYLGVAVIAE